MKKNHVVQEMDLYVYCYNVDLEVFRHRKENEIHKRVELNRKGDYWNREHPLPI